MEVNEYDDLSREERLEVIAHDAVRALLRVISQYRDAANYAGGRCPLCDRRPCDNYETGHADDCEAVWLKEEGVRLGLPIE